MFFRLAFLTLTFALLSVLKKSWSGRGGAWKKWRLEGVASGRARVWKSSRPEELAFGRGGVTGAVFDRVLFSIGCSSAWARGNVNGNVKGKNSIIPSLKHSKI